jgi:P2-related tail formation protein
MTVSLYDLLPPNATQLERDLSRSTSSLERAGGPVPVVRTAKRLDIPDGVVPWLVFEYGLGELLPYLPDQRQAIAEGVLWQRIRGTPAALDQALGWIGLPGAYVDESEGGSARWAEYQIGLEAPVQGEEILLRILGVAGVSQPQRSRLQRVFSVYDYRRFILDDSLLSEGSPLSDHTGTRPFGPDGLQVSFGDYRSTLVDAEPDLATALTVFLSVEVPYIDRFLLDHSYVDEEWHILNTPIARVDVITGGASRLTLLGWGSIPWPASPWGGSGDSVGGIITTVT